MIKDILQKREEFKKIQQDIKANKEAHSYLFISNDSFTAKEFSRLVAQALLCENICGKCENCIKFENEHPDVKYFPRKNQLLVEDSNYIVDESFVKPIYSDRKIFIIDDFDKSTTEAQNKLLKVLEEPNNNMFYLLSTSNIENVLPTIKSRCFKVEIGAFDRREIEGELNKIDYDTKEISLSLGNGYLGRTIELSKKKNLGDIFELATNIVCKMKNSKEVIVYSKKIMDNKEDIKFIFEILSMIMEDLIAIKTKHKELVRLKYIENEMNQVAEEYSMKCITEIEKLIRKDIKEMSYFTNVTLIVDNFLMNMLEVKYLCR